MRNKLNHFHVHTPLKCCTLKAKESITPKLHAPWPTETLSLPRYAPHESEIAPKQTMQLRKRRMRDKKTTYISIAPKAKEREISCGSYQSSKMR